MKDKDGYWRITLPQFLTGMLIVEALFFFAIFILPEFFK